MSEVAFLRHFCCCPVPFGAVLEPEPDDVRRTAAPSPGGIDNVYGRVIVA